MRAAENKRKSHHFCVEVQIKRKRKNWKMQTDQKGVYWLRCEETLNMNKTLFLPENYPYVSEWLGEERAAVTQCFSLY